MMIDRLQQDIRTSLRLTGRIDPAQTAHTFDRALELAAAPTYLPMTTAEQNGAAWAAINTLQSLAI